MRQSVALGSLIVDLSALLKANHVDLAAFALVQLRVVVALGHSADFLVQVQNFFQTDSREEVFLLADQEPLFG